MGALASAIGSMFGNMSSRWDRARQELKTVAGLEERRGHKLAAGLLGALSLGVEVSRPKNVAIAAGAAAVVFAAPVLALPAAIGGAGLAGYGAGAASTTFDRPNATSFERGEAAATIGASAAGLLISGWVARGRTGGPVASSAQAGAVESGAEAVVASEGVATPYGIAWQTRPGYGLRDWGLLSWPFEGAA